MLLYFRRKYNLIIFPIAPDLQHDWLNVDDVLYAMGCAASLLAKRLNRMHVAAPLDTQVTLIHLGHHKVRMPEFGGDVIVTELMASCGPKAQPVTFFHINGLNSDSRGALSWDGTNPTNTQSILEVVVRKYLCQHVM
jgi:hypothetical protein